MQKRLWQLEQYYYMILGWTRIYGFLRIFMDYEGVKCNLHPKTEISLVVSLSPKSSICCSVFKIFVLTDLKKEALTLTKNLLTFNEAYMGRQQLVESFLKNECCEYLVFGGRCVFINLNFIFTRFLLLHSS